jgi:hypothetical protein
LPQASEEEGKGRGGVERKKEMRGEKEEEGGGRTVGETVYVESISYILHDEDLNRRERGEGMSVMTRSSAEAACRLNASASVFVQVYRVGERDERRTDLVSHPNSS